LNSSLALILSALYLKNDSTNLHEFAIESVNEPNEGAVGGDQNGLPVRTELQTGPFGIFLT
jgi:hypothetical protein